MKNRNTSKNIGIATPLSALGSAPPTILLVLLLLGFSGCDQADKELQRTQAQLSRAARDAGLDLPNLSSADVSVGNPIETVSRLSEKSGEYYEWARIKGQQISRNMPRSEMEARKMFLSYFTGATGWNSGTFRNMSPQIQTFRESSRSGSRRGGIPQRLQGRKHHSAR